MGIRVGIIDDHPVVIAGTVDVLCADPEITVPSVASTVQELLDARVHLDLVLLDLLLNDTSTPTTNIRALNRQGIPALAFTSGDRPALVREAARAGAIGMIRKSEWPGEIIAAVHSAYRGETVASADWAASLDDDLEFVSAQLSDREAEVLALYAAGETATQVGAALHITRSTVIEHVKRIREKYAGSGRSARTKHDLYIRAVEDGIVEPGFSVP